MIINEQDYLLQDETKKDALWANRIITHFRGVMKPLVNPSRARRNMRIILSEFDMSEVEKMFKDPKKLGFQLLPIIIMEKLRNILIGEKMKAGVGVNINALDPSAEMEREGDESLLKNRGDGEALFSHLNQGIGLPPWKLADEKKKGKNPFKGNVDMFDQLGLNTDSESEISYFFRVWHKLQHEMDAQALINFVLEHNEVREFLPLFVDDILAKKAIACQTYINDITGVQVVKYLQPEKVRVIPGRRNDGKDAPAVSYEDGGTVAEFLEAFGASIDLERDLHDIIAAVNYTNGTSYDKVIDDRTENTYGYKENNVVEWSSFLNFKINFGYIEWKSWNKETAKVGKDKHGNTVAIPKKASYQIETDNPHYTQKSEICQCTYKAWFLSTSSLTQRLFKFGKLYHQVIEGAEDMYSSFSIHFKKESGPTVAEIAEPWITMAQESFSKIRWMVRRAKPAGTDYNFESLVQIGKQVVKSGNMKTDVMGVIKMFEEGVDRLYTIPKINNQPVGGGSAVHHPVANGLDKSITDFRSLIEWCILQIKDDIAMTQLREAYNAKPNDGLQLQMQAKESSENATNYMGEMIDCILRNATRNVLTTAQDALKFKQSLYYRYLVDTLGQQAVDRMSAAGAVAWHRYGLFVNSFSQYERRKQIQAETQQAWLNKELTYDVKVLVDSIDDPQKAAYILAFEKMRNQMLEEKKAAQQQQNAMQLEQAKHQWELQRIQEKGKFENQNSEITGHWAYLAAIKVAEQNASTSEAKMMHEGQRISDKTASQIQVDTNKHNLNLQQPLA